MIRVQSGAPGTDLVSKGVEIMTVVLAMLAIATSPPEEYKPQFPFCNTRPCDQRARMRRQRRKVQARHKAQVRWARHMAKMRKVTQPYRAWLASTRRCESGNHGLYKANTGNGFYGAYQFTMQSWYAVGGQGMPHNAPPLEQDYRAVRLLHVQGTGAWPVCG
jgi:Transglycosylase-like domain